MQDHSDIKYYVLYIITIVVVLCSCSNNRKLYTPLTSNEELRLKDSLSGGYISYVIETAVEYHIHKYLGFEKKRNFFDSTFLCDFPKTVEIFFSINKNGFSFTLDEEKPIVNVFFQGEPYITVDVSRYNCKNLCCLYRNKLVLYDDKRNVFGDDKIISTIKHGIKRVEHTFIERGYICDSILDVDIPYPQSLFCDISDCGDCVFRCFFDTVSLPQNDYLKTLIDTLDLYCAQYGLSRIVTDVLIMKPTR